MKKITNRLLCALILLCAVGVFAGCKQETENPMKNWVVGTWREAYAISYAGSETVSYRYAEYGYEVVIKGDGTWIKNFFDSDSDQVRVIEKGTWLFVSNADILVMFTGDDGFDTLGSFASDLLMINDEVYKRYQ